jgi:hypothetical protein
MTETGDAPSSGRLSPSTFSRAREKGALPSPAKRERAAAEGRWVRASGPQHNVCVCPTTTGLPPTSSA